MKGNGFWKKTLCLVLATAMVLGNASPVVAAHEHETAAEIVTEITDATIKEAEKLIDKTGLLDAADVTDTKNSLEEADSNLAGSMDNLGTAVDSANAAIDALDGKVTKDDAKEINASLSVAYSKASIAWAEAVAASDAAVAELERAAAAYEAASQISDEAAKVAAAELKAAQETLNAAVEATKFANDNMISLKNEFAKATELATKWSTDVETALVEATAKFEEASAALNNALETLGTEDADFKAAIDTFKACYDAFIEVANTFKASIDTAIAAQDALDALYAEYEAAQAAYAEALAAYEAKCAEYEAAGYPADYDSFEAETERLASELKDANEALEVAELEFAAAEKTYNFYEERVSYLESLQAKNDIITSETATEEEKAEAVYSTAEIIVEQFIVAENIENNIWSEDTQVIKVPATGSEYGKADYPFFVVIGKNVVTRNADNTFIIRYGYEINEETGAVEIFELVAVDRTDYIEYNGVEYELEEKNDGLFITVDGSKIDIYKDNTRYFEKITLDGQFVEDNTKVPEKVNVSAILDVEADVIPDWAISLVSGISWVKLQYNEEGEYYYAFVGVELGELTWGFEFPIDLLQDPVTGVYTAEYNYEVDIKSETCTAPLHKDGNHSIHLACTVHEFDENGNCIKNCIVDEHKIIGHDIEGTQCRIDEHYVNGVHKDNCSHVHFEGIDNVCLASECNNWLHTKHELAGDVVYGVYYKLFTGWVRDTADVHKVLDCEYTCSYSKCDYTSCKKELAGTCEYEILRTEARVLENVPCQFPVTKPQAKYADVWYDVVDNKIVADGTEIKFTESEAGKSYTYEVTLKFVEGGGKDTFYARKVSRSEGLCEDLASLIQKREDALAVYETETAELETAVTTQEAVQAIYEDYSAKLADLEPVYNTYKEAEALATEKELGALAELPKNISELVEGMEVEEMLTLLEAIIELSSQSDDVDYEEALEVLSDVVDADAAARLIAVLAYDAIDDGLGGILPFGIFDDIMDGIGGIIDGIGDKITPPTEFERTYAEAWVDALTTKIKVVQNAIELVEIAVDTVEAGVTAVTEGIELAEVAADAVLATAEKKMLEATVEVLVMANDVMNSSEEVVLSIDNIISTAQAVTEKAYLTAVAESNALNQVTFARPYAEELDNALVAIGAANALNADLTADIALAEASIASAKVLYEELKVLEEHEHVYLSKITEATCEEDGSIVYVCTICTHTYTEVLEATGHSYDAVVTAPTCTEAGYTTYTCATCGDSYEADEVTALGHDYESVVTVPNCTEGGYTTHTCKVCGDTYVDEEVGATGHTHKTEEKAATCEEDGYVTYTCECGDTYTVVYPALGHSYVTTTVNATCETAGSVTTTCTTCGDTTVEVIEALGHNYELTDSKPATCTADGMNAYVCSNCRDQKSEVIAALGHSYDAVVIAPTCTVEGYTTHTCSVCKDTYTDSKVPATGHNYELTDSKSATCLADGSNIYTCSGCKDVKKEVLTATGHDYKAEVTAPGCTTGGYTTYTCNNCGDNYITDEVDALGHAYESVVTAPTCTVDGYTTHTCSRCKESYKDSTVTAPGHAWGEWVVTVEPTEETFGEKVRECIVDGCNAAEKAEVAKLPHTHVWDDGVVTEPTCTTGGYTTFTCTKCNETKVENKVAATGHAYDAVVTAPTCTAAGYTTYTCHCGDTYTGNEVAATGHSFGAWEVTKEATEFEAGIETRTCHCGATETQEIAAIGHTYVATVTAPTCTEQGYTTYTCECGHSYVADYVPALGHSETTVVTAPTCTAEGYTTYTCSVCGSSRMADTVNALGHDYVPTVTAPKCEAEGYTTYVCSRCNDSYVADYVDALGHSFGEWTVEEAATCTVDGKEAHICATCGDKETRAIEALGHTYDAVVTAPTCVAGGYTTYTCSVCSDKYVADAVAAKGHSYIARVIDPTCTAGGYTTYTCACGSYVVGDRTAALNHAWSDWTVTTEATETTTGVATRECATCHATQTVELDMLEASPVVDIEDEETPLADGEDEVVIEDEETPLAGGEDEVVIEDEETPLANGEEIVIEEEDVPLAAGNGGNVGIAVAAVGGLAVVGTGAAVVANQAGLFGAGAAATSAATSAASAGTAGAGSKGFLAAVAAFFKKLFRK